MKLTKRILSLALAALLVCFAGQAAFVGAQAARTNYPTIYMAGGWHELFDSTTGERAFDPTDSMMYDPEFKEQFAQAIKSLDIDALGDALITMFTKAYADIAMDCDGESIDPNLVNNDTFYYPVGFLEWLTGEDDASLPDELIELKGQVRARDDGILKHCPPTANDTIYFLSNEGYFSFDWRVDPVLNARRLHAWIEETFIDTEVSDKVNLTAVSGSGPIMMAYLHEYGTQYLNSVMLNEAFISGSSLWGGIALKKFGVDPDSLGNTGPMYYWSMQDLFTPNVIKGIRAFYEIGLLDVAAKVINFVASKAFDRLYEEALTPMWFHMPYYWALVPHSMYEQAKKAQFPTAAEYAKRAKLFEKTDYFQNEVMANSDQILRDAAAKIKIGIYCGYGLPLSPYTTTSYVSSDELVDTEYASAGATCAPPNRPFNGFFYKQAKPGNVPGYSYVSPDRYVDASTCILPDHTWFCKGRPHESDLRVDGWVEWFANAPKGEDTVHSNATYPQWMQWVRVGTVKPLDYIDTFWKKLLDMLLDVLMYLAKLWRKVLLLPLFWM